jgi:menaquinone-9 beta-reductase
MAVTVMDPASGARSVDVAVVGAGATGAACAAFLAEAGFSVVCLERRALADAGARWVNGVPRAAFAAAGVAQPQAPEYLGGPSPFHLIVASRALGGAARARERAPGTSAPALTIRDHDVIHVDMRHLVARMQARAREAGVQLREHTAALGWDGEALATSAGPVHARWVVDASGLTGARLLGQPVVPPTELCAAAQAVFEIADRAGAAAFLDAASALPGEAVGVVGVAGGYSVLNIYVDHELATVSVLTGSIPALGYPSGKAILDRFVAEHAWVGARQFGGAAAIPLRRPYDRIADERVALLGDAACQVFPAHGSGVGAGLMAARMLADTLSAGRPLREYEIAWQRRHGALLASFDALRRWTQSLDGDAVVRLFASGLAEPELMKAGLNQERPRLSPRALAQMAPTLARALRHDARFVGGLAAAGLRSRLVHALYAAYPRELAYLPSWSRAVDGLLGA